MYSLYKNYINVVLILFSSILLANPALADNNEDKNTETRNSETSFYSFFVSKSQIDYNKLFQEVLVRVKHDYVEDVSNKKLIESALEGMLSALDPHSTFLDEKAFQEVRSNTKGEFGGIGIEVIMDKGFLKVVTPYEDSPAIKAGIKIGDYITMVDDKAVKGMNISQAVDQLRGKPKTRVKITIYRESTNETLEISMNRDIIKIIPVKSKIVGGDVVWLKVSSFSENTANLVKKEYNRILEQSKENKIELKGIILDLRWNPGGLLMQAKEVAELFLDEGIIATTKGRLKDSNQTISAQNIDITDGLPIVVLINGGSASASEIVAGALQDNKRALIAGTKSFGKGSVQTILPLPGNTAMKITTARYYTPSGKSIQAEGITPDVVIEEAIVKNKPQLSMGNEASLLGHLENEDASKSSTAKSNKSLNSNLNETEDFQLLRSIDLVKGMALYSERLLN
jgi:carboxyl-terminal processing protease